ncbi:hypothetical protein [Streptomyces sp. NPDC001781]
MKPDAVVGAAAGATAEARKSNGRHRHLICDTADPLLMINVTAGDSAAELNTTGASTYNRGNRVS